jgi:spermidine synthase
LKRASDRAVLRIVVATGISSVVSQLITIREFLAQFEGNEFVVSLILLSWLVFGGFGVLAAEGIRGRGFKPTRKTLGLLTMLLAAIPTIEILFIRYIRDVIFVKGSSVGFYPTLTFTAAMIAPYALLIGFVLPYSLFVLRMGDDAYPSSRIYIFDALGDAAGGALFSFALVHLLTPLTAFFVVNTLLLAAGSQLLFSAGMSTRFITALAGLITACNISGMALERASLEPARGELVSYRESFFGRILLVRDHELLTVFIDGVPAMSSENRYLSEETVHYPLSQLAAVRDVLLIMSEAGIMEELEKYHPEHIDYAQLDPDLSRMEFHWGLMKKTHGLSLINADGRAYLKRTTRTYDAILVNVPEPKTFQTNRYFTDEFLLLAKQRLKPGGVVSFSVEGYDNYPSDDKRMKISSLYNTALDRFVHVLVLPGQKVFFIASDSPLTMDIPGRLAKKGIRTSYIESYFVGDLTQERISSLMRVIDPKAPRNTDFSPYLMKMAFQGWFAKYSSSPIIFFVAIVIFLAFYLAGMKREEFVLFSSGWMNMGSEILTIFLFQILFGYLYVKIGLIVTVFLAGLIPGAYVGQHFRKRWRTILLLTDTLLIVLVLLVTGLIAASPESLPEGFFFTFAFLVSLLSGLQFPVVVHACGGTESATARCFSVDLMGAAFGGFTLSVLLIPYCGLLWASAALIVLKFASILVQICHGKGIEETVSPH